MIDVFNIPSGTQSTFTFYATGNWQTFQKPRNAKFIQIFCLGAGGGGGGGSFQPTTTARGGSGGGASGGIVRGIIPAFLLPDIFYILVGKGGLGNSSGLAGGAGGISYVSLNGTTSEQTLICKSSTSVAGGGLVPVNTSGGSGGVVPTVSVPALSAFGNLGLFSAITGLVGGGGSNSSGTGAGLIALSSLIVTGGAGGAGKGVITFSGFSITPAPVILTSAVNGGVEDGGNGDSGYGTQQPFCGTGGAGGGSVNTSGVGGAGGNGYYGSGGGGGACGVSAGGKGGNGGDGLVIITVIL
jgi:hypothetical protein